MRRIKFHWKVGIGGKLGLSIGVGVLLVAGIIANEHVSSRLVAGLVAAADKQQSILYQSSTTEVMLQTAQIAARDIRKAQTVSQIDPPLADLQRVADQARNMVAVLEQLGVSGEAKRLFGSISQLTLAYVEALRGMAAKQTEILSLFKKLDEAETLWLRLFNQLVNSDEFSLMPNVPAVEILVNEANSAFKDARIATWRYLVLNETSQVGRITGGTDQAYEKLGYAQRDIADPKVIERIERLRTLLPEYIGELKAAIGAIDAQNKLHSNEANSAESTARLLLDDIVANATELSDRATNDALAGATQAERLRIAAGAIVAVLLIGIAFFASRAIGRPIRNIGGVLIQLADGNTDVKIPYVARGDEIGDTARAASVFKDSLLQMAEIEAQQDAVEARAQEQRKAEMNRLADTFEQTIGEIVNSVSATSMQLESSASTLTKAADTTKRLAGTVAAAAEQASHNVMAVSGSAEEISASTGEISRQSRASSDMAQQAVRQAEMTDGRMTELLDAASRIGNVVNLITDIAEQTNLLALNATIEAARSGEAGRGFAVVANEVKMLAKRTTEATEEIRAQVAGIQSASRESVAALKGIGTTIGRLAETATAIAAAVDEQDATTHDIARNVKHVAHGTSDVATSIVEVNKGTVETETASNNVLISARTLAGESSKLRAKVQDFLATVRAAS